MIFIRISSLTRVHAADVAEADRRPFDRGGRELIRLLPGLPLLAVHDAATTLIRPDAELTAQLRIGRAGVKVEGFLVLADSALHLAGLQQQACVQNADPRGGRASSKVFDDDERCVYLPWR